MIFYPTFNNIKIVANGTRTPAPKYEYDQIFFSSHVSWTLPRRDKEYEKTSHFLISSYVVCSRRRSWRLFVKNERIHRIVS